MAKAKKTTLLFDADMLLFVACLASEKVIEWYDDFFTMHCDLKEAQNLFDEHVATLTELVLEHWKVEGNYEIKMCLTSGEGNYRKEIFEDYKANRKGARRPMCWLPMREWIRKNYDYIEIPYLEADDCVGLNISPNAIAISGDKDFRSLPVRFYDFMRNEFYDTTEEEADYFHLYQTLIGDTADNYKGCPKVGEVRAHRLLDEDPTWDNVVSNFEKNGSSAEEALMNARLAFILRPGYYNAKTKEVTLWTPKTQDKLSKKINLETLMKK